MSNTPESNPINSESNNNNWDNQFMEFKFENGHVSNSNHEEQEMSNKSLSEYKDFSSTLLNNIDQLSEYERSELPNNWQDTMHDVLKSSPETSDLEIRDKYREMQGAWEEASMRNAILRNPNQRGAGEIKPIDGRHNKTAEELYEELPTDQRDQYNLEYINTRLQEEKTKHRKEFTAFLDSFNGQLQRGRVCPAPEYSPFALINTERPDGSIQIDPEFIDDILEMRTKGITDINLVASFATKSENGDTDMSLPDPQKYCTMIEQIVNKVGSDGLTISIGNETNETMSSNPDGFNELNDLAISKEISPENYGKFYREVATRLKSQFPNLKLCTAGTAFLAPNYIKKVLKNIYPDNEDSNFNLVDRVDFHPYRSEVDEPAASRTESKYGSVQSKTNWTYSEYENELLKIAKDYKAELIIGEVQFGGGEDPKATVEAHRKLDQALQSSNAKGITANVWPRTGLPF